jgi:hypothetical protein
VRCIRVSLGLAVAFGAASARAQYVMPGTQPYFDGTLLPPPTTTLAPTVPSKYAPERPFELGHKGEFVLTGSLGATLSSTQYDGSDAKDTTLALTLGGDYFVVDDVSVGVDVEGTHEVSRGYGADGSLVQTKYELVSGGPRIGVNVPLAADWSWYPRLTLGLHYRYRSEELVHGTSLSVAGSYTGAPTTSRFGPWANLFMPVVFQAAPHVFFGLGPRIYVDASHVKGDSNGDGKELVVGGELEVGGYWGGPSEPSEPVQPSQNALPVRRFGDKNTVVISNEFALFANWTQYSGTSASASSFAVGPQVDWFAADQWSVGFGVAYSDYQTVGFESDGSRVHSEASVVSMAGRLGYEFRLGSKMSLYPVASLTVGDVHQSERVESVQSTSGAQPANAYDAEQLTVALTVPLVFHVAPHFFVGIGPGVSHDLSDQVPSGDEVLKTNLRLSSLVGAWL